MPRRAGTTEYRGYACRKSILHARGVRIGDPQSGGKPTAPMGRRGDVHSTRAFRAVAGSCGFPLHG